MERKTYLKWYHKIGYGSGDVAGNVVYALLSAFVMFYLTDTVGLSMGIIGTLMALSKIFDGVTDLFFGRMIDKTKSKMGKARPWMLYPYIGCSVALVACFSVPTAWGHTAQYIFFFITYTLLNAVFFTANNIAYASLTALITKNTDERIQLGSIRFIFAFGTSMLIQYITIDAVNWFGGGTQGWRVVAIIYAIIGLIVNTLSVFSVKELPEADEGMEAERKEEHKLTFLKSLKILFENKYYIIICITYILTQIYTSVIGMGIYYMKYILGDENLFGNFALTINIPMVLGLILLPFVIKKIGGMYKLNVFGYLIATAGRLGVMAAGYIGSVPLMLVFTAIATLGIVPLQGDLNALIASCSEYTTLKTGHRLDGMMYSCSSLGIKIGGALGTAICGWLLDAAGYVENAAVQSSATIGMLQFLYLWLPAILCAVIVFLLYFLKVENANEKLLKEKNMKDDDVDIVYGNI
ncbi:MAG: MFS transporter [Ruminococcaceae bacterium]|nr:MFS transporter [Oscillospiraceae bacterium]